MDLSLTSDELVFQGEVRRFLGETLTPELSEAGLLVTSVFVDPRYSLPWQRNLNARGWAAPGWPIEHGGPGWSEMQRAIFSAECARAGAPGLSPMGLRMVGPCIMGYGTPRQKAHYLPRILSGEDYWCQVRAGRRLGPGLPAIARGRRRRRLCADRIENLDHARAFRQPHVLPGADAV